MEPAPPDANDGPPAGGCSPTLRVIGEIDGLLDASRLLTRTCERRGLHREAHVLELASELLLRRRNYIANASLPPSGEGAAYDAYPCENCCMTYPTLFVLSWLDHLLAAGAAVEPDPRLCRQSCAYHFDAPPRYRHSVEGALYPMGAPYVAGPCAGPPGEDANGPPARLVGESDETERVGDALRLACRALRADCAGAADADLAEAATDLLRSRRRYGFDMDCVLDVDAELCRERLFRSLQAYETRVAAEELDRTVYDRLA